MYVTEKFWKDKKVYHLLNEHFYVPGIMLRTLHTLTLLILT